MKKARTDSGKEEVAAEAVVAALGGAFGPFHRIGGEGLNCYIRSILTALSLRNIVAPDEVENLVDAISDHLDDVDLRLDEMIDAGGLAAAEVRRVIASLTTHVIHGGADVGITIVQWDYDDDSPAIFEANRGTQQVVLLYTPGHFDLLE